MYFTLQNQLECMLFYPVNEISFHKLSITWNGIVFLIKEGKTERKNVTCVICTAIICLKRSTEFQTYPEHSLR